MQEFDHDFSPGEGPVLWHGSAHLTMLWHPEPGTGTGTGTGTEKDSPGESCIMVQAA